MAILINGNGNPAIYAAQDADLIASLAGNTTGIAKVGNEFAYTAEDANTISVADGVIVTKEGRRIQLDAGENDTFTIPAGTAGVTNYYIIGYHLHENASGQQVADAFVQLMANATDTIQEDTFRGGASDVYVSLYRVEQDGVNLGTITLLLPKLSNISQVNSDKQDKLTNPLVQADIIDNLTSLSTTNPLSANQGKVLKDNYDLYTAAIKAIPSGENIKYGCYNTGIYSFTGSDAGAPLSGYGGAMLTMRANGSSNDIVKIALLINSYIYVMTQNSMGTVIADWTRLAPVV